jgi:cholest-4-en-3-one 26-monooxygenase
VIVEPLSIDPLDLVEPARFARNGYPHDVWTRLRAEAPVAFFDPPGFESFWAITKHADIADISSQPTLFSNAHGLFVGPEGSTYPPSEMVVTIDPPQHGPMRRVAIRRFTPRAIRSRLPEIDRIAVEVLDELVASDDAGEFDFVERVAAPLPIGVISWLLGVPRSDWDLLFRWTNEIIGKDDPEFQRPGETPDETIMRARIEMHTYLGELIAQRRDDPRDDVVTELIAAESPSPSASSCRTASSSSRRATRPRATRLREVCSRSRSIPANGSACARSPSSCPPRSTRSSVGSARSSTSRVWRQPTPRSTGSRSARARRSR